jgi:hypothetical protein
MHSRCHSRSNKPPTGTFLHTRETSMPIHLQNTKNETHCTCLDTVGREWRRNRLRASYPHSTRNRTYPPSSARCRGPSPTAWAYCALVLPLPLPVLLSALFASHPSTPWLKLNRRGAGISRALRGKCCWRRQAALLRLAQRAQLVCHQPTGGGVKTTCFADF